MTSKAPVESKDIHDYVEQDSWKSFKYNDDVRVHSRGPQDSESPPIRGARAMLAVTNEHRPYSKATSILDVAAGPATLYSVLFDASTSSTIPLSPSAALLAMDISTPMIAQIKARQAEKQAGDESTWARIRAWEADATDLSAVPDASQSHVLSQMGIFLVRDSDACLREVRRVMAPGAIFSMSAMAQATWNEEVFGWIPRLHPGRSMPQLSEKWRTADRFKAELERNGFERVEIHPVPVAVTFEDARKFVDGMFAMMPFIPKIIDGLTAAQVEEVKSSAASHITENFPEKKMHGTALVGIGF